MNIDYARVRLEEWGDWARGNIAKGIGYPSRSPEQKAMTGSGESVEPSMTAEEEIDRIVLEMSEELREITKYYYVRRWTMGQIAGKLSTTRPTVEKRINTALGFVSGRLLG